MEKLSMPWELIREQQQRANQAQARLENRTRLRGWVLAVMLIALTLAVAKGLAGLVRNGTIRL